MTPVRKKIISLVIAAGAFGVGYFGFNQYQDARFARAEEQREQLRQSVSGYFDELSKVYKTVGRIVEPSVVSIDVQKKVANPHTDLFRRMFPDRDGDGKPDLPPGWKDLPNPPDDADEAPNEEDFETIGTGSGVIIETKGDKAYILTNNHVAGGASEIIITLYDGRKIKEARIVGADPKTDLAVLEIRANRLSPAQWGNSDQLEKGDFVLAFGSPFRYVGSMTHGIVSALNRHAGILGMQGYENFIQVDAPINPGNSGGPLVNLHGEVVGINTAIASQTGGFQGIGFAIPSNQARLVYQQLRDKGRVVRGWVGVAIQDVTQDPAIAESFGYTDLHGVLVQDVLAGTPAQGKLRHGDIVTAVNGKQVRSMGQFRTAVAAMAPGTEVKFDIFRKRKSEEVAITLGELSDDAVAMRPAKEADNPHEPAISTDDLGIKVRTLTRELAQRYGHRIQDGAIITEIGKNSPAAKEMLRVGDVITEVGDDPVKNSDEFDAAMKKQDLKKGIRLYAVARDGGRFVLIQPHK